MDQRDLPTSIACRSPRSGAQSSVSPAYSFDISHDGGYVAFASGDPNLVAGDTNGQSDVFVRNRQTGETSRVSVADNGAQADRLCAAIWYCSAPSIYPAISADGRFVAFSSTARNLVPGDTNAQSDVFVRDREAGTTTRISMAPDGSQNLIDSDHPAISADGRHIVYESGSNVFVNDRHTGKTSRVSVGPDGVQGSGYSPAISENGRYISFLSSSNKLVSSDTNQRSDVFVKDQQTGTLTRVSVRSDGSQGRSSSSAPQISSDGRYVTFFVLDSLVPEDRNNSQDLYVHDRETGRTSCVSVDPAGIPVTASQNADISSDGRHIAFESSATSLVRDDTNDAVDVFVRDMQTGTTVRVSSRGSSQGDGTSWEPAISGNGRFIAFNSHASNLVPDDTNGIGDLFVARMW